MTNILSYCEKEMLENQISSSAIQSPRKCSNLGTHTESSIRHITVSGDVAMRPWCCLPATEIRAQIINRD